MGNKTKTIPEGNRVFMTTWVLALFAGIFGADRFYLGKTKTGLAKLFTIGGLGVWAIFDVISLLRNTTRDAYGLRLRGCFATTNRRFALLSTLGALTVYGIAGGMTATYALVGSPQMTNWSQATVTKLTGQSDSINTGSTTTNGTVSGTTDNTSSISSTATPNSAGTSADPNSSSQISASSTTQTTTPTQTQTTTTTTTGTNTGTSTGTTSTSAKVTALGAAQVYVTAQPLSYDVLVARLEADGYSATDSVNAANSVSVDWNNQAVLSAKADLTLSSFTHQGLINKLVNDKFTLSQALYAVAKVGL